MKRIFAELIRASEGARASEVAPDDVLGSKRGLARELAMQQERIVDLAYELEKAGLPQKMPDGLSVDISQAAGRVCITLEAVINHHPTRIILQKPNALVKPGQRVNTDISLEFDDPARSSFSPTYYFFDGNGQHCIVGSNPVYDGDFSNLGKPLGIMEEKLLEALGRTPPEPQDQQ